MSDPYDVFHWNTWLNQWDVSQGHVVFWHMVKHEHIWGKEIFCLIFPFVQLIIFNTVFKLIVEKVLLNKHVSNLWTIILKEWILVVTRDFQYQIQWQVYCLVEPWKVISDKGGCLESQESTAGDMRTSTWSFSYPHHE